MARHKTENKTGTVKSFIEDAKGELESLHEEMTEWMENMEGAGTNLESTEKYERVQEAAELLETWEHNELEVPEKVECIGVDTIHLSSYGRKPTPRWMRLSNAINMLEAVSGALEDLREEHEDIEQLASEVEELVGNVEGVEFPGMFG